MLIFQLNESGDDDDAESEEKEKVEDVSPAVNKQTKKKKKNRKKKKKNLSQQNNDTVRTKLSLFMCSVARKSLVDGFQRISKGIVLHRSFKRLFFRVSGSDLQLIC